ncbi:hypothetical protein FB107DRAFT_251246 [Schizophyllum commune]
MDVAKGTVIDRLHTLTGGQHGLQDELDARRLAADAVLLRQQRLGDHLYGVGLSLVVDSLSKLPHSTTSRPLARATSTLGPYLIQDPGVTSKEVQSISDIHKAELRTRSVDVLVPTSLAASPVLPRMHTTTRPGSLPATRGLQAPLLRQIDPERQQRLRNKDHASRTLDCRVVTSSTRAGTTYTETTLMNAYYRDIVDGVELKMLCPDWTIAGYIIGAARRGTTSRMRRRVRKLWSSNARRIGEAELSDPSLQRREVLSAHKVVPVFVLNACFSSGAVSKQQSEQANDRKS